MLSAPHADEGPSQHALVTHDTQIEQALDEKIQKKLDEEEKSTAAAAAADTNVFAAPKEQADNSTVGDAKSALAMAGVNIDDLQKQLAQQSVTSLQGNMADILRQALASEDGPTILEDTSES